MEAAGIAHGFVAKGELQLHVIAWNLSFAVHRRQSNTVNEKSYEKLIPF